MNTNKPKKEKTDRRPSLIKENKTLQESIKALQDQNTSLAETNHKLDVQNSVLIERLSNFGLRDLFKNLGLLGIGTAAGNYFNNQYQNAASIGIISALVMVVFSIYDNFWGKKIQKKEKI